MKIAIINYTSGGMSGGYKKYLKNIIPGIAEYPEISSILCALPKGINIPMISQNHPKVIFRPFHPKKLLYSKSILRQNLHKFQPDVIFLPVERHISYKNVPVVNMLQNMEPHIPIIKNNPLIEKLRLLMLRMISIRALNQSNHVIAISSSVYQFLRKTIHIPKNNISLIYYGIDNEKVQFLEKPDQVPEKWRKRFLFTAGSIRPARGLEDLLNSIEMIPERLIKGIIIAGENSPNMINYRNTLNTMIKKNNIESRVIWTGNLNENQLKWCYRNCFAFVMTSRVESFGMIAGEAMANGCVCVSASNPCLPDIFGDCALYYKPANAYSLKDAIMKCLTMDEMEYKKRSQMSKKRALEFSWDICVKKLVNSLSIIAGK